MGCGCRCEQGSAWRADARGRLVLRPLDDLARRRRRTLRCGALRDRSSPGVRGEPGGVGSPRHRGRRRPDRQDGHPAVLPGGDPRRGARRLGDRRRRQVAAGRLRRGPRRCHSSSSMAVMARSPLDSTTRAGHPTWRSAARSPSTTCSPIPPTVGDLRTSRSSGRRSSRVGSSSCRRRVRYACCVVSTDARACDHAPYWRTTTKRFRST